MVSNNSAEIGYVKKDAPALCPGRPHRFSNGKAVGPPATPETMQLLRGEHDLVAEMIKAQLTAEQTQYSEQKTANSQ